MGEVGVSGGGKLTDLETIEFLITAADIRKGRANDCVDCPAAHGLRRKLGKRFGVFVGPDAVFVLDYENPTSTGQPTSHSYQVTKELRDFIFAVDGKRLVQKDTPYRFTITKMGD